MLVSSKISEDLSVSSTTMSPTGDSHYPAWQPPRPRQIVLLLVAAFVVLAARLPRLLLQGRVYAEEGTTYLRYAWNSTALRALVAPHQGYYSLLPNVCGIIAARLLPLSATALFFTWVAAAVQLFVIFLAIQCEAFRTSRERWAAAFALLLVSPHFETWLNLEECQFLLVVAAALVLISSTRRLFVLRTATLAFAGLTSVIASPLVLLFWLRARKERSLRAVIFALSLTLPAIMQLLVVAHSLSSSDGRPVVGTHQLRNLVAYATSRVIFLPFVTSRATWTYDAFLVNHQGPGWMLALYVTSAGLVVAGFLLFARTSRAALALYCAALLSFTFNWYGCITCTYDLLNEWPLREGRYFFPANSMILLALLLAATRVSPRWLARASGAVFVWLLLTGSVLYVRTRSQLNEYPAWLPQVRRWQVDEHQPIVVGPNFWKRTLHLPRHHLNRSDIPYSAYDALTRHPESE